MNEQNISENETNLARVRKRIAKGGKILNLACKAAKIIAIIGIAVYAVTLFALILFQLSKVYPENVALLKVIEFIGISEDGSGTEMISVTDAAVLKLLSFFRLNAIKPVYQEMITAFLGAVMWAVILLIAQSVRKTFGHLEKGKTVFTPEAAKKIRKLSWLALLLALYSIPLAVVVFGLLWLFSFIMEYGVYIQRKADETNRIQEEIIISFAEITENKSGQTGQHIKRVSEYTRILAEQMGYSPETAETMRIASTMHDVGKLMIPTEILEKPGRLTNEEYAVIKQHTSYGGELLKNVEGDEMVLSRTIAMQHHERPDGKGYPLKMTGEEIAMEGKIVAVADVYDALTSRRSYKDAWKEEDAAKVIYEGSGTQFDETVVEAFRLAHDRIVEIQQKYRD